jgi:heme oxygenase (biliverdin-IX-beta and delta-forming)
MMGSAAPGDSVRSELMRTASPQGRARRSLRNETADLHEAVERHFVPGRMTRDGYVRYLLMNRPFASIEPALEAACIHRVLPDWDMRRRRFVLASDMEAMGIPIGEICTIPISDDFGTLLGWSYVLEGSRLGARFILKEVESTQSQELIGAAWFLRHGAGMALWASFTGTLSRIDNDPSAIESACEAARAAFNCFNAVAERFRPTVLSAT